MDNCIVVVPCYNEGARLDTRAFREFVAQGHGVRFLLVNDGSTDDTAAVVETLHRWNPGKFEVCHLPRNMGKAEAVRQGVLRALDSRVDSVGFWDADLATPLEAIPQFCELLRRDRRLQMVIGARVKLLGRTIERRILRHYLGRMFATAASVVLRLPVYDTQCGAKLFRASPEIRALFDQPFHTNWIFDVELLARFIRGRKVGCPTGGGGYVRRPYPATAREDMAIPSRWPGGASACPTNGKETVANSIYEVSLSQWRDVAGSKVRVRDFFKGFLDLARIYWTYLRPGAAAPPVSFPSAEDAAAQRPDESSRRHRAA